MIKEFEKDEYVIVKNVREEARIIRIFENGEDKLYEVLFESNNWHRLCREDELEKAKRK